MHYLQALYTVRPYRETTGFHNGLALDKSGSNRLVKPRLSARVRGEKMGREER